MRDSLASTVDREQIPERAAAAPCTEDGVRAPQRFDGRIARFLRPRRLHHGVLRILLDMRAQIRRLVLKAPPMLRVAMLLSVFAAMQGVAMAEDAKEDKQDTVEVHGKSLTLSCAEWKHNQDGSWTSTGPLLVGTETVNEVTLRGAKETKNLETKCGNGSTPSVTPAQSAEPTRHARHGHHHAEPDGT